VEKNMNKLSGFGLLFAVFVLVNASSLSYVMKASAILHDTSRIRPVQLVSLEIIWEYAFPSTSVRPLCSQSQEPESRATQKAQGNTPLPMQRGAAVPLERSKTIWESVFP
jgi:hypothetical protein